MLYKDVLLSENLETLSLGLEKKKTQIMSSLNSKELILLLLFFIIPIGFILAYFLAKIPKRLYDALEQREIYMIQQSRLAAMGEMITAIAHQWRQPLNTIGGVIINIKDAFRFGELDEKYLHEQSKYVDDNVKYMSQTIDDFKNFVSPSKELATFNIKEVVESVINIVSPQLMQHNISTQIDLDSDLNVKGRSQELQQVIMNLINNAKNAIKQNEDLESKQGIIKISSEANENELVIKVQDNGSGIDPKDEQKIFDAYYTTQEKQGGSGIGLFLSQKIIQESFNGHIEYVGNVDGYTTFLVTLRK